MEGMQSDKGEEKTEEEGSVMIMRGMDMIKIGYMHMWKYRIESQWFAKYFSTNKLIGTHLWMCIKMLINTCGLDIL